MLKKVALGELKITKTNCLQVKYTVGQMRTS